jgi:long-chain acyl-CoA synthetase
MTEMGFWKFAASEPAKLAIVDPDGNETTYGEALAAVNRYSHAFAAAGLQHGDAIAVCLPNEHTVLELYLACLQSGLYFTPINWHLTAGEMAYILKDCDAKLFVAGERYADACIEAADEAGIPKEVRYASGEVPGFAPIAQLTEGQPDAPPADRRGGQAMLYTSGTTGYPKGVRRPLSDAPPDDAGIGLGFFLLLFDMQPGDGVHLTCGPLYHAAALLFTTASMHLGHSVVLMDKWTPEGTLERIDRYKVSTSHLVPTMFHRMLALPDEVRLKYDVSSLSNMVHAAAPCPVETKQRMLDWWGPVVYEYYAATEGGGTLVKPDEWLSKPGTVGQPWPTSEIRIIDDEGTILGPHEVGTVWIKPPGGAEFEYHKDKKKTKENWRDGFFTVGDMGYLDEDGWLFLSDRKADMIISGGVNIYPAEAENVLLTHPKVGDAAVIGVPNDDFGEEVKAIVEPAAGIEPSDEVAQELIEFVRSKLAHFKCPRTLDFIVEMPRTPTGKVLKRNLREPYWEGRERKI